MVGEHHRHQLRRLLRVLLGGERTCHLSLSPQNVPYSLTVRDPQPAPVCYAAYCGQNSPTATPTPAPSVSAAPTTYCGEGWTEFENTCFRFFDTLANYDSVKAASAECANHGGYHAPPPLPSAPPGPRYKRREEQGCEK